MGNLFDGVLIDNGATLNTVGGTTAPARNVISENANGVALDSSYNLIEGNFIGTDAKGVSALGNTNDGVLIHNQASDNVIGGIASGSLNVISGNQSYGVAISDSGTDGNDVEGNDIGTDSTGTKAVPNGASGVYVHSGASLNLITNQNVIDYNAQYGVLTDGGQTLVSGNSIYQNAGGGIGFTSPGPIPAPVLTTLVTAGGTTTVEGTITGAPTLVELEVQFFSSPSVRSGCHLSRLGLRVHG